MEELYEEDSSVQEVDEVKTEDIEKEAAKYANNE